MCTSRIAVMPFGNNQCLNLVIIPDACLLHNLLDLEGLAGCIIFSNVDIKKVNHHQILMNPNNIKKSGIVTSFGLVEFVYKTLS